MTVKYTSENVEVPVNLDAETVSVDLYQPFNLPNGDIEVEANFHMVRLEMSEDGAVELATMLLAGVTKLRAERLAGQGL